MTKTEIIEETVKFYNLYNRAVDTSSGLCQYKTVDGYMCAVGRCLTEEAHSRIGISSMNAGQLIANSYKAAEIAEMEFEGPHRLDNLLQEKYRGHTIYFWLELQELHDKRRFWNENGLTVDGIFRKNQLIATWGHVKN